MASYDWPEGLRGLDVTMDRAVPSGTVQQGPVRRGLGGPSKYMASSRWGLVARNVGSDKYKASYKVVQLWYKLQPASSTSYRPVKTEGGNHAVAYGEGCGGDKHVRISSTAVGSIWGFTVNGEPLASPGGLYCKEYKLYKPFRVTRTHPVVDYTVGKHYRVTGPGGPFSVYSSNYLTKRQDAAAAWKNTSASGSTFTPADISSLPNIFYPDLSVFVNADALLNADPDYKAELSLPPNRLPNGLPNFTALRDTIRTVLERNGWPTSQINAFLVSKGVKIDSTSTRLPGGGSGGGHSNRLNNPPKPAVAPTPAVTKVVVRAPYGFAKPATKAPDNRPQLVQNYKTYVKDNSAENGIKESQGQDIFVFPYTPNNISYSGLGSKWDNIDRAGNFPIVEWSSWDLMRCEMEFLVAENRIDGSTQVPDGLFVSVQDRLNTLRRMSQRQAAVSVFNLDDLFRVQVKRAQETGKALQFVIADLSITSTRRSIDSVEKEITAASVKLTLQEIPIEKVTLVKMSPPIMSKPVTPGKPGSGDDGGNPGLFTDGWRPVGSE